MKKVIVFGTFDLIHPGHIHMLKEAKEYGEFLIVVVARDNTVCDVKGRKPMFDEETRKRHVEDLKIANKVRLGCLGDHYQAISEEKPDIIALGYDQQVFVDNLTKVVEEDVQIVRLAPFLEKKYKSSILKKNKK